MNKEKFANVLRGTQIFADIHSKDMSTKVGAAFVDPDGNTILSRGYNGMPRGIEDRIPERHVR
ncbi:hypothetical protein LC612_28465, partial [Nostoc sp. CHAB 5834]|nr:hypothetical protein [Nostoc sp. CHAB 5834]